MLHRGRYRALMAWAATTPAPLPLEAAQRTSGPFHSPAYAASAGASASSFGSEVAASTATAAASPATGSGSSGAGLVSLTRALREFLILFAVICALSIASGSGFYYATHGIVAHQGR